MDPNESPTNPARFVRVSGRAGATEPSGGAPSNPEPHDIAGDGAGDTARPAPPRPRVRPMSSDAFHVAAGDTPTLADHWSVLRRRRGIIAVCVLVALTVAALWMVVSPAKYTSTSTVVIRPIAADAFQDTRIEDVGAATEAAVVGSTVVADIVARRIGEPASDADRLRSRVEVTNPSGTLLLQIAFSASSARRAQIGAQAFADAYLEHRRSTADGVRDRALASNATRRDELELEFAAAIVAVNSAPSGTAARTAAEVARDGIATRIADLNAQAAVLEGVVTDPGQVIRPAGLPSAPSGPPMLIVLVAAAFLGAVIGVALAYVRDRTDPRIPTRRAMTAITGLEPLAIVPAFAANDVTPALSDPEGRVAGALRRLRVSVWPQRGDGPRRLVVTSPTSPGAADQLAGNLALTLALAGWSTLLAWTTGVDGGGASVTDHRGLDPYGADPDGHPVHGALGVDGLTLLALPVAAGRSGTSAERLAERLDAMGAAFDVEIIVAPALLRAADGFESSPLSDAMLVVVDVADERREDLAASVDALEAIGAPLEGIVASSVPKGW